MNKKQEQLYLDELSTLCNFVVYACQDYCASNLGSRLNYPADRLWYYLQNIVTYTADISKILWGSDPASNNDRKKFRKLLNITEDSPLQSKKFRNLLEHIDINLRKFSKKDIQILMNKNITSSDHDIFVGNKAFIPRNENTLRNYDISRQEFVIFGRTFQMQPIIISVLNLRDRVKEVQNENLDC